MSASPDQLTALRLILDDTDPDALDEAAGFIRRKFGGEFFAPEVEKVSRLIRIASGRLKEKP